MNSRDYKTFRKDCYYHVYNRGDNRENIFLDNLDYQNFLKRLMIVMGIIPVPNAGQRGALKIRPLPKDSFGILAYCLMPNHFHILIKQNSLIPISQLMTKVCTSYSKFFNHKYRRVGHVFQDIFKAKVVESDEYLVYLSAYIHNNPVKQFEYKYSSIHDYLSTKQSGLCDTKLILGYFKGNRGEYKNCIKQFRRDKARKLLISDLLYEE